MASPQLPGPEELGLNWDDLYQRTPDDVLAVAQDITRLFDQYPILRIHPIVLEDNLNDGHRLYHLQGFNSDLHRPKGNARLFLTCVYSNGKVNRRTDRLTMQGYFARAAAFEEDAEPITMFTAEPQVSFVRTRSYKEGSGQMRLEERPLALSYWGLELETVLGALRSKAKFLTLFAEKIS